ncbi:type II toxin-antitoxin system RelE/ParE family toxin [Klebsiella sp. BIGb0407]|uniref:type II toxin-antitoxin system RelE/ParE family toxin n=1 Tax=Klebsiella sp. BIGb0407 TaxID=2940603 RepID=UPI002166DCCE|nr:type II toxin-antitoxin system RelE/ParE family toxin [Klebsiella sp. BIGb0407]MCS3430602.1 phage-related protein [Klebsiella sp. BIGb0407]
MKKFAFVNNAAEREYKILPLDIQVQFGKDLRLIQYGQDPQLPIDFLESVGMGIIELKINGSPAYRCIYIAKYLDTVVVLHSLKKRPMVLIVKPNRLLKRDLKILWLMSVRLSAVKKTNSLFQIR